MDKCLTREEIVEIVEETLKEKGLNKTKRKPSAYNVFIGKCTSEGGDFKSCAKKWKEQK